MSLEYTLTVKVDLLLEKEPTNLQAQSLASLIEQAVTKGLDF